MISTIVEAGIACLRAAAGGDLSARSSVVLYAALLESAALRGDVRALYYVGKMYESGVGVEKDWARAFALLRWAKSNVDLDANKEYGEILRDWHEDWERGLTGETRERALQILMQLEAAASGDGAQT